MSGGEVEKYYGEGRIREIADYCESDVVNTYRVWLRYELFRGHLIRCRISGERGEPH
jgi:3'-5' exonuclease